MHEMKMMRFRNWELKGLRAYGRTTNLYITHTKPTPETIRDADQCYALRFNRGGRP
jgi:hypothetical protein